MSFCRGSADITEMWNVIDVNDDGHLNYLEFCAAFQVLSASAAWSIVCFGVSDQRGNAPFRVRCRDCSSTGFKRPPKQDLYTY